MITTKENRVTRFSIRATAKQKELIARAAARRRQSISEFVLENSLDIAHGLELDHASLVMSPDDFREFLAMLDEPTEPTPLLRKLMSDPTSVDVPNN
jgi:uncharacterized protein (DUF1778 family)